MKINYSNSHGGRAVLTGFWLTVFKQKWGRTVKNDNASFVKLLSSFVPDECDVQAVWQFSAVKGYSLFEVFNQWNVFPTMLQKLHIERN